MYEIQLNIYHLFTFDFCVQYFFLILSLFLCLQSMSQSFDEPMECVDSNSDVSSASPANTSRNNNVSRTGGPERNQSFRNMKIYAKQMLKNRIFLGHYQEKRYVNKLGTYKDLIVMNRNEQILCDDIVKVQLRIANFYAEQIDGVDDLWLGFTHPNTIGAPAAYCIWTTLNGDSNTTTAMDSTNAFGEYWFQIKTIKFHDAHTEIQLKVLRPVNNLTNASFALPNAIDCDSANDLINYVQNSISTVEWAQLFSQWQTAINQNVYRFATEQVTVENMKNVVRIIGVLLLLLMTASIQLVHYMGEFSLKFLHEFSRFLHVATPIIIALIETMGKIVGGLYILIAMSIRGQPQPVHNRGRYMARKPPAIKM